jgi:hypothetical protein
MDKIKKSWHGRKEGRRKCPLNIDIHIIVPLSAPETIKETS